MSEKRLFNTNDLLILCFVPAKGNEMVLISEDRQIAQIALATDMDIMEVFIHEALLDSTEIKTFDDVWTSIYEKEYESHAFPDDMHIHKGHIEFAVNQLRGCRNPARNVILLYSVEDEYGDMDSFLLQMVIWKELRSYLEDAFAKGLFEIGVELELGLMLKMWLTWLLTRSQTIAEIDRGKLNG